VVEETWMMSVAGFCFSKSSSAVRLTFFSACIGTFID
jgi:hypothetical protein